jgi:hypothetical protein
MTPQQRNIIDHLIEDHLLKHYTIIPAIIREINNQDIITYKLTPLNNKPYRIEITFNDQLEEPGIQVTYFREYNLGHGYKIANYEHHIYDIANPNYEQHILQFIQQCDTRQ